MLRSVLPQHPHCLLMVLVATVCTPISPYLPALLAALVIDNLSRDIIQLHPRQLATNTTAVTTTESTWLQVDNQLYVRICAAGKHVFNTMHNPWLSYLRETELVHALSDAPLCSPHVLGVFWSLEQQSLFILNSHTTLKEEWNLSRECKCTKRNKFMSTHRKKQQPQEMPVVVKLTSWSYLFFSPASLSLSKRPDAQKNLHPLWVPFITAPLSHHCRFHCSFLDTQIKKHLYCFVGDAEEFKWI